MNTELVSNLEELGLSEKEARVYMANLMLGEATVQKIADQADIKRVTTYVILESLVNLGLASQITKGKKTYFIAEEPISLRRLLDKKEQELKDQKVNFEGLLPQLKELKTTPQEAPNVRFYDSAEGIRAIVSTFLSAHKSEGFDITYGITNVDQLYAFFPEIAAHSANPGRLQSGLPSRVIYTSKEGPIFKATDKQRNRESRFVPPDQFPLNGDLNIMGDHVIILTLAGNKPIGVAIESQEVAKSMRSMFELAWKAAEKFNS